MLTLHLSLVGEANDCLTDMLSMTSVPSVKEANTAPIVGASAEALVAAGLMNLVFAAIELEGKDQDDAWKQDRRSALMQRFGIA